MTIKELEARIGMERANIRFYEKEGLLSPRRLDNGYRDYSEEDADLLLRIKLLRSLHLPLDEIRAVKEGKVTLISILDRQQQRLSSEEKEIALAGKVCREIREEGASFAKLDAEKYLRQIEEKELHPQASGAALQRPSYFSEPARKDTLPHAFTPFRRFFARCTDLLIYNLILYLIVMLVFRINIAHRTQFFNFVMTYLAYGLMLLIEPVLLHFFGQTPGKWLWGLRVEGLEGRLSLHEAWTRTLEMFGEGMGWGLPVYSLWREFSSLRRCLDNEVQIWDAGLFYTVDESRTAGRAAGFAAVNVAGFGVLALAVALQMLPPNRGELTVAEYAENYNYYVRYFELSGQSFQLDENGRYAPLPDPPGSYTIYTSEPIEPEYAYQLENGNIRSVTVKMSSDASYISSGASDVLLSVLAYSGAECNILDLFTLSQLTAEISENVLNSYSVEIPGGSAIWTVDSKGYTGSSGIGLFSDDETEHFFNRVLTIEKNK